MSLLLVIVLVACAAVSFGLSVTLVPIVRRRAIARGFIDRPGGHKHHERPVALGGGIGIALALLAPLAATVVVALLLPRWLPEEWLARTITVGGHEGRLVDWIGGVAVQARAAAAVIGGAIVLFVLGLIDDVRPLGPWSKMAVMGAVALALAGGFRIRALDVLGPVPATIVTTFWIVLVTNAFNFLDNMDGLSAGVAAVAAAIFACASLLAGQVFVPALALLLVGALAGFLVYNFPPASIFMGDAGSLVVGYFLALLTVLTTYARPDLAAAPFGVLAPLVVLAVPIYDVTTVVWLRVRGGVSPFRGDRRHFSHRLVRRGLSPRAAVLTIYLATAATGGSALLLPRVSWPFAVLIAAQCFCVVLIVAILESADGPTDRPSP